MIMNATDPRCPECGAPVHLNSRSCAQCGAKRGHRGWLQGEGDAGLGLSEIDEDDFDYEEFVAREFGENAAEQNFLHRMTTKQRFWWLVAVLTLIAFAILSFEGAF